MAAVVLGLPSRLLQLLLKDAEVPSGEEWGSCSELATICSFGWLLLKTIQSQLELKRLRRKAQSASKLIFQKWLAN